MIHRYDTEFNGHKAEELCFNTGKKVGRVVYIDMPDLIRGNHIDPSLFPDNQKDSSCMQAIAQIIYSCNSILTGVYIWHYRLDGSLDKIVKMKYHFFIRILALVLYDALFLIIRVFQEEILPGSKAEFIDLQDFVDEVRRNYPSAISQNSLELCLIIDHVNYLYQSGTMVLGFNTYCKDYPTVPAAGLYEERLVFHNHAWSEIITAFSDFIKEVGVFEEREDE